MKAYMFEGSPEEVAAALKAMGVSSPAQQVAEDRGSKSYSEESDEDGGDEEGTHPLPFGVAKKLLTRRPISENVKEALMAIYNAGDTGITGSELADRLGHDPAQFRGMMGAFGRRMVNTDGWQDGMSFFDWSWEPEEGYRYKLFESSRKAVEAILMK